MAAASRCQVPVSSARIICSLLKSPIQALMWMELSLTVAPIASRRAMIRSTARVVGGQADTGKLPGKGREHLAEPDRVGAALRLGAAEFANHPSARAVIAEKE